MTGRRRAAFGLALALALGAGAFDAVSEERTPAPVSDGKPVAKPARPPKVSDVSAVADPKSAGGERLGIQLESDAPFEIDADTAEMLEDGKGGESVRFRGNVTLTQGELELTCDRLDAFFPEGRGKGGPQKFVASGDVQVVQGDLELRCRRAEFEDASCIAVCLSSESCQSGKWPAQPARFRRGKDWIEGRELEFNKCTGKMVARCGARLQVQPQPRETAAAKPGKPKPAVQPERADRPETPEETTP